MLCSQRQQQKNKKFVTDIIKKAKNTLEEKSTDRSWDPDKKTKCINALNSLEINFTQFMNYFSSQNKWKLIVDETTPANIIHPCSKFFLQLASLFAEGHLRLPKTLQYSDKVKFPINYKINDWLGDNRQCNSSFPKAGSDNYRIWLEFLKMFDEISLNEGENDMIKTWCQNQEVEATQEQRSRQEGRTSQDIARPLPTHQSPGDAWSTSLAATLKPVTPSTESTAASAPPPASPMALATDNTGQVELKEGKQDDIVQAAPKTTDESQAQDLGVTIHLNADSRETAKPVTTSTELISSPTTFPSEPPPAAPMPLATNNTGQVELQEGNHDGLLQEAPNTPDQSQGRDSEVSGSLDAGSVNEKLVLLRENLSSQIFDDNSVPQNHPKYNEYKVLDQFLKYCDDLNGKTLDADDAEKLLKIKNHVFHWISDDEKKPTAEEALPTLCDELSRRTNCTKIVMCLLGLPIIAGLALCAGFALVTGGAALLALVFASYGITGTFVTGLSTITAFAATVVSTEVLVAGGVSAGVFGGLLACGMFTCSKPVLGDVANCANELPQLRPLGTESC